MPEVSRFHGIVIMMFYKEHNPPHFHANYGEYRIVVNILDRTIKGFMPKRAIKLIFTWMDLYEEELKVNWKRCKSDEEPFKIEPLK